MDGSQTNKNNFNLTDLSIHLFLCFYVCALCFRYGVHVECRCVSKFKLLFFFVLLTKKAVVRNRQTYPISTITEVS